jgi:hypothetical protein
MDDAGFDLDLLEEVTPWCFRAALFDVFAASDAYQSFGFVQTELTGTNRTFISR